MPDKPASKTAVNPYQVVEPSTQTELKTGPLDDAASRVSFRLSPGVLRHAIDHLLLHRHPLRLSIGSLLLIFVSGVAIFWAASQNFLIFLITLILTMGASSLVYTALIYRSKSIMRTRVRDLGLIEDSICVVEVEGQRLVMTTSNGKHRWSINEVKVYRTPFGIVLCPEPMTPIHVPRKNNSPSQALSILRQRLTDRGPTSSAR